VKKPEDQAPEYRHTAAYPFHISTGGIVYRKKNNITEIILLSRTAPETTTYHLPKGTLHHNETIEACALREILEESGQTGEITSYIGGLAQSFIQNNEKVEKIILYFAVKQLRDYAIIDNEHDKATWYEITKARSLLEATEPNKKEYEIIDNFLALNL
jgi:8-oxo-dGTP diphosphatase